MQLQCLHMPSLQGCYSTDAHVRCDDGMHFVAEMRHGAICAYTHNCEGYGACSSLAISPICWFVACGSGLASCTAAVPVPVRVCVCVCVSPWSLAVVDVNVRVGCTGRSGPDFLFSSMRYKGSRGSVWAFPAGILPLRRALECLDCWQALAILRPA